MAEVKLEDAPQSVRTFYDKGIAAMERANLDYAMDMFEAALHIEPRLLQTRKLLRAAALQKHKANPPGNRIRLKNMGRLIKLALQKKGDPFPRLEEAEKLMRCAPFNLRHVNVFCAAAGAAELPEVAIQTLEILTAHAPAKLALLKPLADLYRDTQQFKSEYECRNQIVQICPNDPVALKQLKDAAARNTMDQVGWKN